MWPDLLSELTTASISKRLASLGSERWAIHFQSRQRIAAGEDIIELTIGEPDVPAPKYLIDRASQSMREGRTGYAGGQGEPALLEAIAQKYAVRSGRSITKSNALALPGTQAALSISMLTLVEKGDAVLVADPLYATYEGVVEATGADFVTIPTSADNGYKLTPEQIEKSLVPNAKVLLLNSPHNPTGAVLNADEIAAIGEVCKKQNLWILSDEVYEPLIYEGEFASPFDNAALADRTIAVSSISKSHAAPGFRSGWAVGPTSFIEKAQSVAESILFGNQPFIADMTVLAINEPDDTAKVMAANYKRRIDLLCDALKDSPGLHTHRPSAGMFLLVDVSKTGMSGHEFALELLDHGVAVMPGRSFGMQAENLIRLSLTVPDDLLKIAAERIAKLATKLATPENI